MVSLFIEFGLPHWLTFGKVLKKFLSLVIFELLKLYSVQLSEELFFIRYLS